MKGRRTAVIAALAALILIVFPLGLTVGGVAISPADIIGALSGHAPADSLAAFIIMDTRLPALITALLAGAGLSVAGLLMQTCFNNPLAGPSIMGVSSGANLGVALVIMCLGSIAGTAGRLSVMAGAAAGALAVLGIILIFSTVITSADVLLIVGILIGYLTSSVISLLYYFSSDQGVHSFVVWGLGTFAGVSRSELWLLALIVGIMLACAWFYSKSLNALLLGTRFADNVGVSVNPVRTALLCLAGILTAAVTAWCGPIAFIGLIVPHIARMLLATSNHRPLLPATALCGALLALLCQILAVAPLAGNTGSIPINAITPVIGVPVIIYVLLNRRRILYFN